MKKILKEWKNWLAETKPTEKYFTNVKPNINKLSPKDQAYNRALSSMVRQKDFRSTFKVWLGAFMRDAGRQGQIEWLVSQMKPEEKMQAARDLNIMRYIYSAKEKSI